MTENRIVEIDAARGAAIVLMVVYHIFFDLNYFGLVGVDLDSLTWVVFQRIIGISFVLIAGISLVLSESRNREGYLHHAKRGMKLAGVAVLITLATWLYPHDGFIQFGIIHMLALSTLIAPFFLRFGKLNLVFGVIIIAAGLYATTLSTESHLFFWLGINDPGYHALDHYPMLPWFGVILIGMAIGQSIEWTKEIARVDYARKGYAGLLSFLGRNSLAIYLLHQPMLVGAISAYQLLL